MKITVFGDFNNPVIFETSKATALVIENDEGKPNVIFRFLPDGQGWIRYTAGEDKNFHQVLKELEFNQ